MAKNHKQLTTMLVEGLFMTEQRQQQVGQAVFNALAHQDIEMDAVTIKFKSEEQ